MLDAPEPAVRLAAALDLIGTDRADNALSVVLDVLHGASASPELRREALEAMSRFDDVPADRIAEAALRSGGRSTVRL